MRAAGAGCLRPSGRAQWGGREVWYFQDEELRATHLDSLENRRVYDLTGRVPIGQSGFSPDGRHYAFIHADRATFAQALAEWEALQAMRQPFDLEKAETMPTEPQSKLRLKCFACEALARIAYLCAAHSPHLVDLSLYEIGLHNRPGELRGTLQDAIDAVDPARYDAVVLIYGLCGQATCGLQARRVPVVIPKAHDCITLFLGDRKRYKMIFEEEPGTYWYSNDYLERKANSGVSLGTGLEIDLAAVYDEYVEKYGQDNADYLMEVMGTWREHYKRAVYIDNGIGDGSAVESQARSQAAARGWQFEPMTGDLVLIRRLLAGDWADDFLVLQPGQESIMTYDEEVIGYRKAESSGEQ